MKEIYSYPIHPLARKIMRLTEENALKDPFFGKMEESITSLLIYYLEELFGTFTDEYTALDTLQANPQIFTFSLDIFQKAFFEMPDISRAKQVFAKTSFATLTPNWEDSDRKIFMHSLFGLRHRFNITDPPKQPLIENYPKKISKSDTYLDN